MKPVLNAQQLDQLLTRAGWLDPAAKALWGNMTVSGMLFHCTLVNNRILAEKTARKPTLKQRLLKPVVYLMTKLPQGVKTGNELLASEPDALDFEHELAAFKLAATRFAQQQDAIQAAHPIFGPLNTWEWRRFAWLHLDHHLRQFSV